MRCSQCQNEAMFELEDHPLCLHCYSKYQQIVQARIAALNQELNYIADMMEATTGVYGVMPRYPVPQPPVMHTGPMTLHNIKVDRSIVGSINTGTIARLDVALGQIGMGGNEELRTALAEFTQAVLADKAIDDNFRNELLERLAFIGSQMAAKPAERQRGIVSAVMTAISLTVQNISTLGTLWDKARQYLERML